jgi:hypothetical protein
MCANLLPEIEITPEMIEAGLLEFRSYNYHRDDERETVKNIWMAMASAVSTQALSC